MGRKDYTTQSTTSATNTVITLSVDGSSGNWELEQNMAHLMKHLFKIFKKKQSSYGPKNISTFGEKGVVVRMNDKLQRLIQIVWHENEDKIEDEKIEDTYLDLADYALIAILVRNGLWPK